MYAAFEQKYVHLFYFSSEMNAYQTQIKVISITSEMRYQPQSHVIDISLYFYPRK